MVCVDHTSVVCGVCRPYQCSVCGVCGPHQCGVCGPHQCAVYCGSFPPLQEAAMQNLFYSYIVRLHQKDDLEFLVIGLTNLLSNPLTRTYLPSSRKKIGCVEELLVLTWKLMEANKVCISTRVLCRRSYVCEPNQSCHSEIPQPYPTKSEAV